MLGGRVTRPPPRHRPASQPRDQGRPHRAASTREDMLQRLTAAWEEPSRAPIQSLASSRYARDVADTEQRRRSGPAQLEGGRERHPRTVAPLDGEVARTKDVSEEEVRRELSV